ncbi:MAG: ATP-dependent DNA ligase [Deltaproteobacteria bacterium]|nr:ATP-dependent DNA ligase [Deltaproteobacteria bacterium]
MDLPVSPPVEPMLATRADDIPDGDGWCFEPKWDGFRALVFRDGAEWYLQSRDKKPLARYFPELEAPVLAGLPERCVLDGEIVIAGPDGLDFEALQMRLHPAASRNAKLAAETPASLVFWDCLALGDADLTGVPFAERRETLTRALSAAKAPLHVTPLTTDREVAREWFHRFEGAGLDGLVAKRADGVYTPGQRTMVKVKHARTADCVVAGFRWHKGGEGERVGSLMLGLYDGAGRLQSVGVAASFTMKKRAELVALLAPYRVDALEGHPWQAWQEVTEGPPTQRQPGMSSRWNPGKSLDWEPIRPDLVCEVGYDHMQGSRFRHTAQFKRWRPDKAPADCTYAQLDVVTPMELERIFGIRRRGG